jgi:hypothetical protein
MLSEHEWVYERMRLHTLMKEHPDWGARRLARALGHDPKWVLKWKARILNSPKLTLEVFRGQSRAPKHVPRRTSPEAKAIIGELRRELSERYYRPAGARTIQYGISNYLKQYPNAPTLPHSRATIYRILHELHYLSPCRQRWHDPLILPTPMDEWEIDFGEIFLPDDDTVFEFFMVVDRGTSRLIYLEGSTGYNAETALEALVRLFSTCGLPKRLRFDRDPRLWGAWSRDSYPSPMIRMLRVLGIEDVPCPPHRPDKKPFVERCIETLKYEHFARFAPTTLAEAQAVLANFPHYYNEQRPHQGQACQNRPPEIAFPAATLPKLPMLPDRVHPDYWLNSIQGRIYRRRVTSDGTIQIDRHTYAIGSTYRQQPVAAHILGTEFIVEYQGVMIKQLPIRGLYGQPVLFDSYLILLREEARTLALHYQNLWRKSGDIR